MSVSAVHAFDPDRDLVLEDGVPLESWYHRLQMVLFLELARYRMLELGHTQFFLNGDMFIYYSHEQAAQVAEEEEQMRLFEDGFLPDEPEKKAYRGPDVFLVKDVPTNRRDVWKVWDEGERYPDLIVELLSPSTATEDYGKKKKLYQDLFKTSEYFLYAPDSVTFDGFRILDNTYQPIQRSAQGRRWSRELEVYVGIWHGEYEGQTANWLRLFYSDGTLVPTNMECREAAERRAEAAERRAEVAADRAELERQAREAAELEVARLRALYESD